ncbi:hypothetical protein OV090_16535 [Nannocystis sp. RBIL2]|uniref:hypothetical protein n=1 Tax=Nannocystis sp. RBIL2 TaxID=2996788 RepID=UPI00226FAD4D|nr:hypothetical protein [Nannocystis sp. RBIL2]MCY1066389.1 hypothetical protein [Nannocystis sp. RBIL2]
MKCDRLLLLGLLGLGPACSSDKGDTTESETSDATTEPGTTGPTTSGTETGETTTTGPGTTETPTTTSTTTSTTDETTTDGTTGGGFPDELAMGCGFTRPCDDVLLLCGNDSWSPECTEAYTSETQCALEQLAAGAGFPLRYDVNGFNGEEEWYDLVFDGEGGALRQNWLEDPGSLEDAPEGPVERCVLKPVDFFADCLTLADDDPAHAQCMLWTAWFESCEAADEPMCPTL